MQTQTQPADYPIGIDQSTRRQWAEGIGPHVIVREFCEICDERVDRCECPAEAEVCDE